MERPIDANKLKAVLQNMAEHLTENGDALIASCLLYCQEVVDQQRTMDAVPVVYCDDCVNHGNCIPEDTFRLVRIEKPFCCVGRRADHGR